MDPAGVDAAGELDPASRGLEARLRGRAGWAHCADGAVIVENAIERLRRGIELARGRKKAYLLLGRRYEVVGEVSTAERAFTRAVQIRPDGVEASREIRLPSMLRDESKGILERLLRR